MIREIEDKDIAVLVEYGKYFWDDTPFVTTGMEYDPDTVAELIAEIHLNHYLRVYEKDDKIIGFIGILITPFHFNKNYTIAAEMFFFVHPEHRGSVGTLLLDQAQQDLKDLGVSIMSVGDMFSSIDLGDYYTRLGFKHTENTYVKVI